MCESRDRYLDNFKQYEIDFSVGQLREDREPWLLLSTYRVPGITERKDSKESAKDCVKRRGPLFGRLYNVSATSENWEWIKLDESRFQA
jgi:hypothetical protein